MIHFQYSSYKVEEYSGLLRIPWSYNNNTEPKIPLLVHTNLNNLDYIQSLSKTC